MKPQNFRERERIKRKAKRWAKKFAAMTATERRAVLKALHNVEDDAQTQLSEEEELELASHEE